MEGNYRIEAERWLTIAEKLLTARDFQGAKTFAIRARESDPRLVEFADQIIAVAETIVAGELRIINYTGGGSLDYYAILQLPRLSQSMELVATQYRKLAVLLNPSRNRLSFADHAFRLVSEAWLVFSNPSKKAMYDNELQVSQLGQLGQIGQFGQMGGMQPGGGQEYPQGQSSQGNDGRSPRNDRLVVEDDRVTQPVATRPNRFQSPPRMTEPIRPIAQHKAPEPIRHVVQPRPADPVRPQAQVQVQPRPVVDPVRPQQAQPRPADPVRPQVQNRAPEPIRPIAQPVAAEPSRQNPAELNRPAAAQYTSPESNPPVTQRTSLEPAPSTKLVDVPVMTESEVPSFWTACPYCFILYEYPKVYEECAIRCQKCKRAFHATTIPSPPITGKDTYFCSWAYFPVGFSGGKGKGGGGFGSNWSPVSAMFAAPFPGGDKSKKINYQQKRPAPSKVIYEDEEYINLSDPSDGESDSDDDWDERRKKVKNAKGGKSTPAKSMKRSQNERLKKAILQNGAGGGNVQGEAGGKGEGSSGKKRGTKDLGRLDLNVMFSNEVEEAVPGVSEGNGAEHGEEDNIEGIGFFEGLDEFLSSLPILSVVGDDKVKAS